jgi:Na+/H+ antiporter NhaB
VGKNHSESSKSTSTSSSRSKGDNPTVQPDKTSPEAQHHSPAKDKHATTSDGHDGHDDEEGNLFHAAATNFLGHSSKRFKCFVLVALIINIPVTLIAGKTIGAWCVLCEFLVTLAMALEAYPLQAGGLLVIEANLIGLTNPHTLLHEVTANLNVILMIIFMVASIHFLKNLLLWIFTKILLKIPDKSALSVVMLLAATIMSAFLDALTVSAVVCSVCTGFLGVYYHVVKSSRLPRLNHLRKNRRRASIKFELVPRVSSGHDAKDHSRQYTEAEVDEIMARPRSYSGKVAEEDPDSPNGLEIDDIQVQIPKLSDVLAKKISAPTIVADKEEDKDADSEKIERDISRFKAFLRSLLMHCAVGTTFGGIMTMVGEPQNLIIAERMEWSFGDFMIKVSPVWASVLPCGVLMCILLEKSGRFGYGTLMPDDVRQVLQEFETSEYGKMTMRTKVMLAAQGLGAVILVIGLILHLAEVGFIGLTVVILLTSLNGVTEEHEIAHAFLESMPFVSLLVVFFGIVGMIHDRELFKPIIEHVLALDESLQTSVLFLVNGLLSMVSDNVFVATIFVDEINNSFRRGMAGVHVSGNGASVDHPAGHHRVLMEDAESHMSRTQFERLGISIVAGTNLPSMATPNGQASLLFILTSNIAPLVHLSYRKMCIMTLPYTIMATTVGLFAIIVLLPLTD